MKRVLAFLKQHVLPTLVCFGVAAVLAQTGVGRRIENVTLDERTKLRAALEPTVAADEVALLAIDETSIRENGRWPWNREVHGDLLQLLARARPAVVTWDILFTEPTPADDYLARCAAANRAVVLGAMLAPDEEEGITSIAAEKAGLKLAPLRRIEGNPYRIPSSPAMLAPQGALGRAAAIGFVDTPPGDDGVRRTAPLVVRVGDDVYPTLSLRTLMEYWGAGPDDVTIRLGDAIVIEAPLARRRIPVDETGGYTINYRHGRDGFVQYGYTSAWSALQQRFAGKKAVAVPPLTGRIALVGQVADGLADFGPTPFSPLTPLVLVHANIIENVLREDYVRTTPWWLEWGSLFLVALVGTVRLAGRRPFEQLVFAAGVPLLFGVAAVLAWINASWMVAIVGPLLGFVAAMAVMIVRRMMAEARAKEQIKGMFGTYVSPELVNRLIASGRQPELGGHQVNITAFFSDIQEFSSFAEVLPPDRLVVLMNEYLTACTDIVQTEGGTLDKYIGDAIVAMFGAPVMLSDHAYRACLAVVRVQQRLEELRTRWQAEAKWPEIVWGMRTRIGLNSGPCVIGNMGSRTRFNYTMMGDNVNLAARMESGAKAWGAYAMCTEATRAACDATAPGQIAFRPLGRIQVKGRAAAVPIHEIVGLSKACPLSVQDCIGYFTEGLARYYDRDWAAAETAFHRSAALERLVPGKSAGVKSNPSLVYLQIVERLRREPPPSDWDGVYVMTEK